MSTVIETFEKAVQAREAAIQRVRNASDDFERANAQEEAKFADAYVRKIVREHPFLGGKFPQFMDLRAISTDARLKVASLARSVGATIPDGRGGGIHIGIPKKDATETIIVNYKNGSVTQTLSVDTQLTKGMTEWDAAESVASAINVQGSSHGVYAAAANGHVQIVSWNPIRSVHMTNNSASGSRASYGEPDSAGAARVVASSALWM